MKNYYYHHHYHLIIFFVFNNTIFYDFSQSTHLCGALDVDVFEALVATAGAEEHVGGGKLLVVHVHPELDQVECVARARLWETYMEFVMCE